MLSKQFVDPVSLAAIRKSVFDHYGIETELHRLPGENLNFLACVPDGQKFVVKVAADDQSPEFIEMEYQALKLASTRLPGLRFPTIVENNFGNAETFFKTSSSNSNRLRIIEFISGVSLEDSDISDGLRENVGVSLALFDQAMEDFDHPAARRDHRWNLVQAGQHRDAIHLLGDEKKRALLAWAFDEYKKIDSGIIKRLKWQFIHGDANPENILVEGDRVVGLLDFGDSCYNPRICELAICLPYLMMDQPDPLASVMSVIKGYESVLPLSEEEHAILAPLVLGRLATTLSVATQRRQVETDHPNWFVSEERAWRLLDQLHQLPGSNFSL
ncbi:MAG TPA: phosphotransferase [Xanthomonadales bacterium]|nr:phosphotransferase [Xanthomonadales bacterium]